jgi:hypothetical protein
LVVWLLTGYGRATALRVTMVLFTGYILFLGWRIAEGARTCGCFGEAQISPQLIFALDLAVLVTLATDPQTQFLKISRALRTASLCCLAGCLFLVTAAGIADVAHRWRDTRPIVVYKTDGLVGQQVPTQFGEQFNTGIHEVFLYREGCPSCHEKVLSWKTTAQEAEKKELKRSVLIIPYSGSAIENGHAIELPHQRLSEKIRWIIDDSKVLVIIDGIIVASQNVTANVY